MTYFSVPDFEENHFMIFSRFFPDFEENRFLIFKKIVSDVFTILFRFWRKSFFDFRENRFLIFSWFLETRFIKLICIRKNTEKIVCKLRDFNTILSTIYSTKFLVWAAIYPPPPCRGILQGYIFLKAYTKCYKMSHVSTLAVGAFRIFGVKREEIMQKSLKIGNIFLLFPKSRYRRSIYACR